MMPTSAEIRATYMEAWPDALFDLSIPTMEIELSKEDLLAIGSTSPSFREHFSLGRILPVPPGMRNAIAHAVKEFPLGVFPRLGTCSFKRVLSPNRPLRTLDDVISEITSVNERPAAAIKNALRDGYPQSLFLREWRDIPAWSEFRVFIRDQRIAGISQYHHRSNPSEIEAALGEVVAALIKGVKDVLNAADLRAMAADFYLQGPPGQLSATLIEINPLYEKTDPCLYSWTNGGDFDGRFRFRSRSGKVMSANIRATLEAA